MRALELITLPWREPLAAAEPYADEPWTQLLLSGASARWSYLLRQPTALVEVGPDEDGDPFEALRHALGPTAPARQDGPPFQGGVAGLATYEFGARAECVTLPRQSPWPDLAAAVYPALLAFDHLERQVLAIGRAAEPSAARLQAGRAASWLDCEVAPSRACGSALASEFLGEDPAVYEAAVGDVVRRIAAGEIFQANIARAWRGRLETGRRPWDLLRRLAEGSPAPFAAYFRLPGLAVVSNSPERFLSVDADGAVRTQPIKGTRPRGADPVEDRRLAEELADSAKDRAENLMIVDLMRNDLSRACAPGSVRVPDLCRLRSYSNVHHLVSTVTGRLAPAADAIDLFRAAFPPGSITGAPKVQAMQVIRRHEAPRGPYCGSLFWAGFDGSLDSSVLIRTVALQENAKGWRFEARAGAGIVADSEPASERLETETKIAAIRKALLDHAQ